MADFSLIFLKPGEDNCLYFCHHLYETYRNKSKIQKLTFVEEDREILLYCDCCLKKIVKYTVFKYWSKDIFDDVKKNLIQYFVKVDEFSSFVKLG